jgi:hypothetical protein
MMSQVNSKYSLEKQLSRYKCKLFLEHNSIQVDEKFLFRLRMGGEVHSYLLRHFGEVESIQTGETWSFIDFLDEHFSQKRSTIMNNLAKCLNLKKPNGGNL